MSEDKNSQNEKDENRVEEPATAFNSIHVYNSFDEMEQDHLKWLASLSPEEHLQHATSLIKRVFAKQLEKYPELGKHITFD